MNAPQHSDWAHTPLWYDKNAADFISKSDALKPTEDLKSFAKVLRHGAKVLDLGCGTGRDLETFLRMGFDAHGVDGSETLSAHAADRINEPSRVRHLNFLDYDDAPKIWDGIWAMASLIHVSRSDRARVFSKVLASLKTGGVFTAFFKSGQQDIIDGAGRAMSLMDKRGAIETFLPLMKPTQRISTRTVIRPDTRGDLIEWTGVEISS
jgi:SAM-dependent methyltransferase